MDFDMDDSLFEGTRQRKKCIAKAFNAKHCPDMWFLHESSLDDCDDEAQVDILKNRADLFFYQRKYEQALEAAEAARARARLRRVALRKDLSEMVARCQLSLGEVQAAVAETATLLEEYPAELSLHNLLADCFFTKGDVQEELLCRQRCLELNSISYALWLRLFAVYANCCEEIQLLDAHLRNLFVGQSCRSALNCQENTGVSYDQNDINVAERDECCRKICSSSVTGLQGSEGNRNVNVEHITDKLTANHDNITGDRCCGVSVCSADGMRYQCLRENASRGEARCPHSTNKWSRLKSVLLGDVHLPAPGFNHSLAMGCLAHARCHLEITRRASAGFVKDQAVEDIVVVDRLLNECACSKFVLSECRKRFGRNAQENDEDQEGQVVDSVCTEHQSFERKWFPWLWKD